MCNIYIIINQIQKQVIHRQHGNIITGLTAGGTYNVKVKAYIENETNGLESEEITKDLAFEVPQISISDITVQSFTVNVKNKEAYEGLAVTYKYYYKLSNNESTTYIESSSNPITGLKADTEYDLKVNVVYNGKEYDGTPITQKTNDYNLIDMQAVYGAGVYLFNKEDQCTTITGGWTDYNSGGNANLGQVDLSKYIDLNVPVIWCSHNVDTVNDIDLTNYSKLIFNIGQVQGAEWYSEVQLGITTKMSSITNCENQLLEIDLTEIESSDKVRVFAKNEACAIVTQIYLVE